MVVMEKMNTVDVISVEGMIVIVVIMKKIKRKKNKRNIMEFCMENNQLTSMISGGLALVLLDQGLSQDAEMSVAPVSISECDNGPLSRDWWHMQQQSWIVITCAQSKPAVPQ